MPTSRYELGRVVLIASLVTLLSSCGGSSSDGVTNPPVSGSEVLYAANSANSIFSFQIDETKGNLRWSTVRPESGSLRQVSLRRVVKLQQHCGFLH
jgi:hypothetical protein